MIITMITIMTIIMLHTIAKHNEEEIAPDLKKYLRFCCGNIYVWSFIQFRNIVAVWRETIGRSALCFIGRLLPDSCMLKS
jgi:hypothetical protein